MICDQILENLPSTHKWNNKNLWLCTPVVLKSQANKIVFAMIMVIEGIPSNMYNIIHLKL